MAGEVTTPLRGFSAQGLGAPVMVIMLLAMVVVPLFMISGYPLRVCGGVIRADSDDVKVQ